MGNEGLKIVLVEDEDKISGFITTILKANGYSVLRAADGVEAMRLITGDSPDLILLDLGLPDTDGLGIIRALREWSLTPILVVSARSHERDKVEALDLGADDYITKPFGSSELLARVRAALRRAQSTELSAAGRSGCLHFGELTVDFDKHRVFLKGEDARLTQNEFKIVALLARYSGKVLTYDNILREIWGPVLPGDNQILRVNMANIRRKLEDSPARPKYVFTEMGVGYRMVECS